MVTEIRPHAVLNMVAEENRLISTRLPDSETSILLIESTLLIALEKITKPKMLFEFGTYLGEMTYHFALNSTNKAEIITLNMKKDQLSDIDLSHQKEVGIAERSLTSDPIFLSKPENNKIKRIFGNSVTIDLSIFFEKCQYVYVDGGHTDEILAADSRNANKMIDKSSPSVIVWHDYGNPDFPNVKSFLDTTDLNPIYHIAGTRLAFHTVNLPEFRNIREV